MNLEEVIIELQSRVMKLSDKVDTLEKEVYEFKNNPVTPIKSDIGSSQRKTKIIGKSTKPLLIKGIVEALAGAIPVTNIRKGSRNEGSGLILSKDKKQLKLCLRGSGHYKQSDVSDRMLYTGFSTLRSNAIFDKNENLFYDFFVFGINTGEDEDINDFEFFIFTKDQFRNLLDQKPKGDNYYFYFGETTDQHYIDDREKGKTILIDNEHNNWQSIIDAYESL